MGLQIMTNTMALNAQRHLEETQERMQNVFEKLSSGSRINKASDDAAGLAISDSINAKVRSLGQAVRNAQDGISFVQVFEGGTNEISNMLIRIRELAMQASSDSIGTKERSMVNNEAMQLKAEVERLAQTTEYAGTKIFSGNNIDMEFQVGYHNDPNADRIRFSPGDSNMTASALGIDGVDISQKGGAQDALDSLDAAIDKVNDIRARVGSIQSRLQTAISSQQIFRENLEAARSRIRDADLAIETSNMARELILRKAGVSVLTQANQNPTLALELLHF
ncbi:MAG: flagellin FliC [Deltaproteobacteria bacterium]|nr:flagellin FliC [Deltaproteobacteria bacterium]MBI3293153.1 flagellin FliC [Deltaproteobacteria bacterium]